MLINNLTISNLTSQKNRTFAPIMFLEQNRERPQGVRKVKNSRKE